MRNDIRINLRVKKKLVLLVLVISFFIFADKASAIEFNIKIGNPPVSSTGTDVASWGKVIAEKLSPYEYLCPRSDPSYYMYNKLTTRISNSNGYTTPYRTGSCGYGSDTFFCTNMVISSYALAGLPHNWSQSVYTMVKHWENTPGFVIKSNTRQTIDSLEPGDVIFLARDANGFIERVGGRHVVLVKNVYINSDGNGRIYIYQANSPDPESSIKIENFVAKPRSTWKAILFGFKPRT